MSPSPSDRSVLHAATASRPDPDTWINRVIPALDQDFITPTAYHASIKVAADLVLAADPTLIARRRLRVGPRNHAAALRRSVDRARPLADNFTPTEDRLCVNRLADQIRWLDAVLTFYLDAPKPATLKTLRMDIMIAAIGPGSLYRTVLDQLADSNDPDQRALVISGLLTPDLPYGMREAGQDAHLDLVNAYGPGLLTDPAPLVRERFAVTEWGLTSAPSPYRTPLLDDPNDNVRHAAVRNALGTRRQSRSWGDVGDLARYANDPNPLIRLTVHERGSAHLHLRRDEPERAALDFAFMNDPYLEVRRSVLRLTESAEVLAHLASNDPNPDLRAAAQREWAKVLSGVNRKALPDMMHLPEGLVR